LLQNITINNVDTPIFLESCYQSNTSECLRYPSQSTMKNIHIDNVMGTSTGKKNGTVGDLRCPPSANCTVFLTDIDLTPGKPGFEPTFLCEGLAADPGVPCKAATIDTPTRRRSHFAWDDVRWE
jgi:galacturan 1,4-alpha-galacturonidase